MTDRISYPSRSDASVLFESFDLGRDPEQLISNFVLFELTRLERSLTRYRPDGDLPERLKVLFWYINAYANHRLGEKIPLSQKQISFLNASIPIVGFDKAVTVAFYNSILAEKSELPSLTDRKMLQSNIYWWCVEKLPPLRLEDRLVTQAQIKVLSSPSEITSVVFPLNVFMELYASRRQELDWLDCSNPQDRAAFYYYLLLQAFLEPHLARYVPQDFWRRAVLTPHQSDGRSFVEILLDNHLSGSGSMNLAPHDIIYQGKELLELYGFSVTRGWTPVTSDAGNSGACFDKRWPLADVPRHGVNVIGPLMSTSGLGQAARLSLEVLKTIEEINPATTLFGFDNPAPIGFSSEVIIQSPELRQINLIHLNAESIPLAFAYLPAKLYEQSYNIGYFFWELNAIPECHKLALTMLDEIWVSSEYNRETYSKFTSIPVTNVGMPVEPVPALLDFDLHYLDIASSTFVFLLVFDSFSFIERKNPLEVVNAFLDAFPLGSEDVCLLVKTQNRTRVGDPYQIGVWEEIDSAIAQDHRIKIIDETFKYERLLSLKAACNCYVSLHRSEGWGFGMIEAMQLGLPVICTGYSGNEAFCNRETAFLVDYELISPVKGEYIFVPRGSLWANPLRASAVSQMRKVFQDPVAAAAIGKKAQQFISQNFSLNAIGMRYSARLQEIRHKIKELTK